MGRSTVHYVDSDTNNILKQLHNRLRPAGTPVQRVEYIIELLLLRIFEAKLKQDDDFKNLRKLFDGEDYIYLFSHLQSLTGQQALAHLNREIFPFYANILTKVKELSSENLSQKVQDYLVLIEEVFTNSNFTNNVTTGVMHIVIELVSSIDEQRILKTDLLGDAIESALSETGGTQDIGLYRTPDHIRQMMVAMVHPTFKDRIFDPTCGTGGFLFDSYQYVMEQVKKSGEWPGEKAHPEMRAYFKQHFQENGVSMPSQDTSNAFYREGIAGIEYLGMIRKMAAINLFIRGLNPANIKQGDSLQMYTPALDQGTKTAIIANPPFGAERDQAAYPDVWKEHAKESETTILFVKLMFDCLQTGGRCAVVVSEGFLTWNKTSARALRKMLLEEATLRAVISLPQGVFVSKQGQGAKTSILYFEKGGSTDWVWYYKIENDGFASGINRTPIEGSQIPEVIDFFYHYVKKGIKPPENKHSFVIPADWIKTLDPRVKETIRRETREVLIQRNQPRREKKVAQLDDRLKQGKIDKVKYAQQLRQFDESLESKIQNEIAKRIEKAHVYSLNLPTYVSDLSKKQIDDWHGLRPIATSQIRERGIRYSLDHTYKRLTVADPKAAFQILVAFDPRHSLKTNIARGYLRRLDEEVLERATDLQALDEILKGDLAYPLISVGETCRIVKGRFPTMKTPPGPYPFVVTAAKRRTADDYQFEEPATCIPLISSTGHGHASLHRLHYEEGKFALANLLAALLPLDPDRLNAKYMYYTLQHKKDDILVPLMTGAANVSMKSDDLKGVMFPLPPIEAQLEIVDRLEKQELIIDGVEKIEANYRPYFELGADFDYVEVGQVCTFEYGSPLPEKDREDGEFPVIGAGNIIGYHNSYLVEGPTITVGRRGATSGTVLWIEKPCSPIDTSFYVNVLDTKRITRKYLFYALQSINLGKLQSGSAMPGINRNDAYKEKIPLPPIQIQNQIVEKLDNQMEVVTSISLLKTRAEKRIQQILDEVWGDNQQTKDGDNHANQ